MKRLHKNISILTTILIISTITLLSCDDNLQEGKPQLVLEGYIDSDGYPIVMLTTSFVDGDEESLSDKIVRWGKVTINDGEQTIIMTGGPDKRLIPPYAYYTYEMKGEPGKIYTVEATWHGMTARSCIKMPPKPEIIEVITKPIIDNDTLREVTVKIKPPQDTPAYYHISTRVMPEETCWLPSAFGSIKAEKSSEILSIPIHRGKSMFGANNFTPLIPRNRFVMVRVERVTEEIYNFWQKFNETVFFGSSMFVGHSETIGGNIEGGYGYFSAQGAEILILPPVSS